MDEDQQHNQAFGDHTGISTYRVNKIKDNDPEVTEYVLRSPEVDEFTDLAWRLLGRYIANNTHLKQFDLDDCSLTDEIMASLFGQLVSSTLHRLDLDGNDFGIDGVRCMVPFLQNSPNLKSLSLCGNTNINSECFEVLVSALDGNSVTELYLYNCSITNISALETYNLPNLRKLNLNGNDIGREGIITISNLLQKEGSTLENLHLENMGMRNEEVELLATALKHNTTLEKLHLDRNNDITNEASVAFLELLVDVSSIESTYYNSNHALTKVRFTGLTTKCEHINSALQLNEVYKLSPHTIGREKVIKYQLNSQTRKELCESQGIEYSAGSIFADIEPTLLPLILALIGDRYGQSELYIALVQTAPELLSYIDRKALLRDEKDRNEVQRARIVVQMKELTRQLADLEDEDSQLNKRLALIELGDSKKAAVDGGEGSGWEKRQRIN